MSWTQTQSPRDIWWDAAIAALPIAGQIVSNLDQPSRGERAEMIADTAASIADALVLARRRRTSGPGRQGGAGG